MIESKVKTVRKVSDATLSDGVYNGTWSGNVVSIVIDARSHWELLTEKSIRSMGAICEVTVKDGNANVRVE